MKKHNDDWETIFQEYQRERKPNADAIAELSHRNFMEMSSKTADPDFLLQKKIEKWFYEKHPDKWIPVYSRVTFSERPYAEALQRGRLQDEILMEMCGVVDTLADLDLEMALERIEAALAERGWTDA